MTTIRVDVNQIGPATSEGSARGHRVLIDRPESKGGHDRGAMGGELLLAALGGCFMSNLLAAIKAREAEIADVRLVVEGTLADSPQRYEAITVTVAAHHSDKALLEKLVTMSDRACIVSNTLRGSVDLQFVID
ncbi:MAG: OsmC family protein [Chromatiales bacterium]|jgi:putative redox protein